MYMFGNNLHLVYDRIVKGQQEKIFFVYILQRPITNL